MSNDPEIFISFKNKDPNGNPTEDSSLAQSIHELLLKNKFIVFFSNASLEERGITDYKEAIDNALDTSKLLIAVGTSTENLSSRWVRYEWESFFNDILSGLKPDGKLIIYLKNEDERNLPRTLRQNQVVRYESDSLDRLLAFVANGLRTYSTLSLTDRLAFAIHKQAYEANLNLPRSESRRKTEEYIQEQGGTVSTNVEKWEELSPEVKTALRNMARSIIVGLKNMGHKLKCTDGSSSPIYLCYEELDSLCERQHIIFCQERISDGWTYGATTDFNKKLSPSLVPYADLEEKSREWYRCGVRDSVRLLGEMGVVIERNSDDRAEP